MLVCIGINEISPRRLTMIAKTKILSVTRDPVLVSFLKREINDGEYEIINTQQSGVYLKEVLDAEHPEFIILDIMMPSLDGIGTCLQLRQWTQAPIMMLSTWSAGSGTVRGLNLGSEGYLSESFGADELRKRISETLKRRSSAMANPFYNSAPARN
jgi:two-component system, OmpR family, alkaline phosphatase synthesis response regulator PhoP